MNNTVILDRPSAPPPSTPKPFPTIWAAIGWVALLFLLQLVTFIAFVLPKLDSTQGTEALMAQLQDVQVIALPSIQGLVAANLLLILLFALYVRKGTRRVVLGLDHWGKDGTRRTLRIAAMLIAAALALNITYSALISPHLEMQAQLRAILAAIPPTAFNGAMIFVATVILAPIVEELVFRGMLQSSLARKLPIWAAIGISAAVFSAMHGDLNSAPALMAIGAIFGTLYHLTGSLRVTIVAHLANNLMAIAALSLV